MEFLIKCSSVEESNLFLRKLWSELNTISKNGWCFMPHKEKNTIHIGRSNFGAVSFDYEKKGCINKLFIDYPDDGEFAESIKNAVVTAKKSPIAYYTVVFYIKSKTNIWKIEEKCMHNVYIKSNNNNISLSVNIKAYSEYDVKNIVNYISNTLLAILLEYTNLLFSIEKIEICKGRTEFMERVVQNEYNFDWVDFSEIPKASDSHILLPQDFFYLVSRVAENDVDDDNMRLVLNSCRVLLSSSTMAFKISGIAESGENDMIDTLVVSSIEPLSCIFNKEKVKCTECGNMKYSIVAKMKALLKKYTDENFAKYFCNTFYTERSKLLHEGVLSANGFFYSVNFPMIDPESKDKMITPRFAPNLNLQEYSTFLFRKTVNELIENDFVTE